MARGLPNGLALLVLLLVAAPVPAQMSRLAVGQALASAHQGDFLLGAGFSYGLDREFPLSGLTGDLLSAGRLRTAYALADHAVVEASWDVRRLLDVEAAGPSSVPLDDSATDGRTEDVGDVRLGLSYAPFRLAENMVLGGFLFVELPNSSESRGIGSNTTNLFLGSVVSVSDKTVALTGRLGFAILEAPLRSFRQDDVIVYGLDALLSAGDARLLFGVAGQANPRRTVSRGAEDLGTVTAGIEWGVGTLRIDGAVERGFARRSPRWRFTIGAAWSNAD